MPRAAFYLASGAAVASLISIAACQVLLGAAVLALLLSRQMLRIPRPILVPLACFVGLTLLAVAVSSDPRAGLPQVKKFYVFLMLPVVFTAVTRVREIPPLIWTWAAAASASGLWALAQFWTKREYALSQHRDFYTAYVGDRATGFMGHWMTFGAAQMVALMMLLALLFFAPVRRYRPVALAAVCLIGASIMIGWTRSVWVASALGILYLIAVWRPKLLMLAPLLLVVAWFVSPRSVRERVVSIYRPHGQVDSNQHRYVTMRTGFAMIHAHPFFGIGPEMPGKQFEQYVPADIVRPLPEGFYGHLHNVYLQYAAERGLPALGAFACMMFVMLRDWWRRSRQTTDGHREAILHGAIAAMIALLVEGLFEHNLGDSEVLSMFWVVAAWGYRVWEADA